MGITTEFLYKIYPRPETLPCFALIFIENGEDLRSIEKAAEDQRYQITLQQTYSYRDMSIRVCSILDLYRQSDGIFSLPRSKADSSREFYSRCPPPSHLNFFCLSLSFFWYTYLIVLKSSKFFHLSIFLQIFKKILKFQKNLKIYKISQI